MVFIPLLCLYHFYKVDAFKVYNSLEFSVSDKYDYEKYKVGNLRKYRFFSFGNEKPKNEHQLNQLRFFVHHLVKQYDTINGAKIHFESKMDYDTFVRVISIMSEENVPTWALFENNIYAFANAKSRPKQYRGFFCDTGKYSMINTIRIEKENRKKNFGLFRFLF